MHARTHARMQGSGASSGRTDRLPRLSIGGGSQTQLQAQIRCAALPNCTGTLFTGTWVVGGAGASAE